jgi:Ca-activated chloride channel family protein
MHFASPGWLWLVMMAPLPLLLERRRARIAWPTLEGFPRRRSFGWLWLKLLPPLLRGLSIAALAVALARPQTVGGVTRIAGQGVAIVAALDRSSSMKAVDFAADSGTRQVSRLEAAKMTFSRFVEGRSDDLVGLVVFANYPDLLCPPTLDHQLLLEIVASARVARPGDDGTNIGDAIVLGLDTLRAAPPTKKLLVLLTDGNNQPAVPEPADPEWAAGIARDLGVTLHTIAIGRPGGIVHAVDSETEVPVMGEVAGPNLPLLERLAEIGAGRSFVATDADALQNVFKTIDALEKSPVRGQILTRYHEHYAPWAAAALSLLFFDRLLSHGRLRRLP